MPVEPAANFLPPGGGGGPGQPVIQGQVSSFVNNLGLAAQATVTADRRYVRLSLSPTFQTITGTQSLSGIFNNPSIPGFSGP
jgi:hypothetical protein